VKCIRNLVDKPKFMRPLRRRRRRREDNRVGLRKTGWEGVDWIHLDEDND
jgi:hypothetical protein